MICNVAQRIGFADAVGSKIALAVDEALCNVIKHGYQRAPDGWIWMDLYVDDGESPSLTIVLEDRASQIDPDQIRSRDLDDIRPGGLGVHIIKEIMDHVTYEKRDGGGMRLTMRKDLSAVPETVSESVSSTTDKGTADT